MKNLSILFLFIVISINTYSQTSQEYYDRGLSKANLQDISGAIADFTKGIEIKPDANAYLCRGNFKYQLEDFYGAKADYNKVIEINNKALEINPKDARSYYFRGLAKLSLNQKESGCLDLSKAGELGDKEAYDEIKKHCN